MPITEKEKVDYLLGCMPKDLKLIFISGKTDTAENLFDEIKNKYNLLYHMDKKIETRLTNTTEEEDMMDLDLINNILNTNKNKSFNKSKKFCRICKMNNHNTEECYFKNRNKNKNKNKNANRNKNFNRNKYNFHRRNHLSFISNENKDEIYSTSEDEISFINNINYKDNNPDNNSEKYTTWIYDTGASEHITNNKNILKNFTNKKVSMKCANNTICNFLGYGTYEGKLNNHNIKLNKVYYSDKIAKKLNQWY